MALKEACYDPETHARVGPVQRLLVALGDGKVEGGEYVTVLRRTKKGELEPSSGYLFRSFTNLEELVAYLNSPKVTNIKGGHAFFEVILKNTSLCVAFDLEYSPGDEKHAPVGHRLMGDSRDKETFLKAVFVDRVLPFVSRLAGRPVKSTEFMCCDASNDTKLSFHLASNLLYIPADRRASWVAVVTDTLGDIRPLVDLGVYNSRPF